MKALSNLSSAPNFEKIIEEVGVHPDFIAIITEIKEQQESSKAKLTSLMDNFKF